jgi:hypothetical protein
MANEAIDKAVRDIFNRIRASARRRFKERFDAAKADITAMKNLMEADLRRLTALRLRNEINKSEFNELMSDKIRLAEMAALTQAGIALIEVDKFRHAVIDIALKVVFDRLIPL